MRLTLALLAFVLLVYGSTLNHPFFFDDSHFIQNNAAIHSAANLLRLWTSATYNSVLPSQWGYRPFTTFLHSIAWLAGGGETWPFHLEKIFLHALTCFFLCLVWKRLWATPGFYPEPAPCLRFRWRGKEAAWAITPPIAAVLLAFVFAAHPANTEVLNYISASTTLLAGCCYIAAYFTYLRYRETGRGAFIAASLALYALSVLAKEEGITLVGVVFLTELILPSGTFRRRAKLVAAYFATAALMALLLKLQFAPSSSAARGDVPRWHYFMTQWRAYLRFIGLLIWPWSLNADNFDFGFSHLFWEARVVAAFCGNLLLLGWAWVQRKRYPIFLFGLLWFYIAVSPASSIVPLAEPVNDHRMYLAYFGLVGIALPWVLKVLESFSSASGAVAAVAFLGMIAGTEVRNHVWSSTELLWSDTVDKNPTSSRAYNNLAITYMLQGEWPKASELLTRSEQLEPRYLMCKVNQAILLAATGHDEQAESKFHEAINLSPVPEPLSFYAGFLMARGRFAEALELYRKVDEISQGADLRAKLGWARAALNLRRDEEANHTLDEAKSRFGDLPEIRELRANEADL